MEAELSKKAFKVLLPDDVPTQEEIEAMDEAEAEYLRGECYSLDDLTLK